MNARLRGRLIFVVAAVLLGCGCSTESPEQDASTDLNLAGQWRLMLAVIDGAPLDAPDGAELTLVVSSDGNQARAGCSGLSFEPQIDGQAVRLAEVKRGGQWSCLLGTPDGPFNDRYLDALSLVTSGERTGSRLTLRGPGVTLAYAPAVN